MRKELYKSLLDQEIEPGTSGTVVWCATFRPPIERMDCSQAMTALCIDT